MKKIALAALMALTPVAVSAAELEISGAFLRASPKIANAGAGFVSIRNPNAEADTLLGAEADISAKVELHTHIREGDMMLMRQVPSIPVPAGEVTALKPGADHIMFITLTKPLNEGDKVPVTLVFAKAGRKVVEFPVMSLRSAPPAQ